VAGHRPHPETRGSIEGVVKDTSGAVLPGVTVEARSPALVGVSTATTDAQGIYRFPALAPGVYEVSATLAGFSPRKVADIQLLQATTSIRPDPRFGLADQWQNRRTARLQLKFVF